MLLFLPGGAETIECCSSWGGVVATELPHQTDVISCLLRHVLYCAVSGAFNNFWSPAITEPPSQSTGWIVRQCVVTLIDC